MNKHSEMGYDNNSEMTENYDINSISASIATDNEIEEFPPVADIDVMGDEPTAEDLEELDDETIDEVVKLISTANIEEVNVYNLLKAVKEKFPKVVEGFEDLI